MLKRIFLFLIVIASLFFIGFTLWQSSSEEQAKASSMSLIADDAVLIFEVADARTFHAKLKQGSVLWPDLSGIDWFSGLDEGITDLDSIFSSTFRSRPDSSLSYSLSLHPSGKEKYGWLLCIPSQQVASGSLLDFMSSFGQGVQEERTYGESTIYSMSLEGEKLFAVQIEKAFYLSKEQLCLERHIRLGEGHILKYPAFARSYATKGTQSPAFLHIDWSRYSAVLSQDIKETADVHLKAGFAAWSTSDLLFDANSIYANGLIQSADSVGHLLQKYRGQGSGSFEALLEFLPSHTAQFKYHHISRLSAWGSFQSDSLTEIFDNGLLSISLEGGLSHGIQLIPLNEADLARAWLQKKSQSSADILGRTTYQNVATQELQNGYGIDLIPHDTVNALILNETLILCASSAELKDLLLHHRRGKTLSEDPHFQQLKDDIGDKSALFYYFNIGRCADLIKASCSAELASGLTQDLEQLQKFQALIIQYEPASDGLFHQNIMLRHNPVYKKESSSIWEIQLDSLRASGISLIKNHYTDQFDILVQERSNDLILLDNTGRELWSLDLGEEILSEIHQVDLFKNGKIQMAFNTASRFIILDRKGRMVDGFPVQLSDSASSELAVMDYDNNRNYRFLIATADGDLHNYDYEGKEVKGWKYSQDEEEIVGRIQHFVLGKKDYICTIGSEGSLRFIQRNGKLRFGGKELTVPSYDQGPYQIQRGKKIKECSILYQNGQQELALQSLEGANSIIHEEGLLWPGLQGQYSLSENAEIQILDLKGEQKRSISHGLDSGKLDLITREYIGLYDAETDLYYLYDNGSELMDGFPIPGEQAKLKDINLDGSLDLLICTQAGSISLFSLN